MFGLGGDKYTMPDWPTMEELSQKYGVTHSFMRQKAAADGWTRDRAVYREKRHAETTLNQRERDIAEAERGKVKGHRPSPQSAQSGGCDVGPGDAGQRGRATC